MPSNMSAEVRCGEAHQSFRLRQEGYEFKVILSCIVIVCLKKNKKEQKERIKEERSCMCDLVRWMDKGLAAKRKP